MSQHSDSTSDSHGGDDHDHDIAAHVRTYLIIFGALLIGTVLTVAMYYVDFSSMALTVAVALFIASIKAFLVAEHTAEKLNVRKLGIVSMGSSSMVAAGVAPGRVRGRRERGSNALSPSAR